MKTLPIPVCLMLVVALGGTASADEALSLYRNARFGFSVLVPKAFIARPAPANGDGRTFMSQDGRVEVTAWGMHDAMEGGLKGYASLMDDEHRGDQVTLRAVKKRFFVMSGFKGKGDKRRMFYEKVLLDKGTFSGVSIVYPEAHKAAWNPVVVKIARSLRAGKGHK